MIWAGATILVLGIGFFLRYAFEHGWIGPTARVALGILSGVTMLAAGERARRQSYRFLSQGLTGGGIGALYLSFYAASGFYHLLDLTTTFVFMTLVTATAIALAVLQDALAIAVLATLGGILTPILLSTGEDRAEALFVYLGVLNLGVLGAALYRRWRALDLLAYAGTMFLYSAWFTQFYRPERMSVALSGLFAFFLLFIVIPCLPVIRGRAFAVKEAALLPLGVGLLTYFFGHRILHDAHRNGFAGMLVLMAFAYLLLASWIRRSAAGDRALIGAQLALSMTFFTLAIPARLGLQAVTVAWAVEGPMLLWLGYRYAEPLVRVGGCAVLSLAFMRVLFIHQPLHHQLFLPVLNRPFATVMLVAAAFGVGARISSRQPETRVSRTLASSLASLGGLLAVFIGTVEIVSYGTLAGSAFQQRLAYGVLTWVLLQALWAFSGLVLLGGGLLKQDAPAKISGGALLGLAALAAVCARANLMEVPGWLVLNRIFLSGLLVCAALWAAAKMARAWSRPDKAEEGNYLLSSAAALALLWWIATLESYRYFASAGAGAASQTEGPWKGQLAVTITWALFAVAMLAAGFLAGQIGLRYAAFALLGLAGIKVVLVDMAQARQIYRVISLIALGLVMVGVSYAYSRIVQSRKGTTGKGTARGLFVKSLILTVLAVGAATPAHAALSLEHCAFVRDIQGPGQDGIWRVALDAQVLNAARSDLGDLRLVSEPRQEVAYVVRNESGSSRTTRLAARVYNREFVPGKSSRVVLDFGAKVMKNALRIETAGSNFRREVDVEASEDGRSWRILMEKGFLFQVEKGEDGRPFRKDTVDLPAGDQRYLRVRVCNAPGDPRQVEIASIEAENIESTPPLLEPVPVALLSTREDAQGKFTEHLLDTGAKGRRLRTLRFSFNDSNFHRPVRVEGRDAAQEEAGVAMEEGGVRRVRREVPWSPVASGTVRKVSAAGDGESGEEIRTGDAGFRFLRVRIYNGDDPPLKLREARGEAVVRSLLFQGAAGRRYHLYYGNPGATPPRYDLAEFLPRLEKVAVASAGLGAQEKNPEFQAKQAAGESKTARSVLLVASLLLVLAVLAWLIRSIRSVPAH
jgi:uncharacterized membrane protein